MSNQSLFAIVDDMLAIDRLIDECESPDDPETKTIIDNWWAEVGSKFADKVDNWCAVIGEAEARAKAREEECDRLERLAKADQGKADWMRGKLKMILEAREITKLDTPRYKVSVGNTGGKLGMEVDQFLPPWDQIGDEYKREVPAHIELNKDKVRAALESGIELPFARLKERTRVLRIK